MNTKKIPENHNVVMPYLIVNNALKFIEFMQQVFNGELTYKGMRSETVIMHAEIKIGDSTIMFADSTEQFQPQTAGMFVYVDDADAAFNKAVSLGAEPIMELEDKDYGRSGGVKDPFGNTWWITSVIA